VGVFLADAVERIVVETQTVAHRIVVADVLHERAAAFYEHYGFKHIPGTLRLVQKVNDVAASPQTMTMLHQPETARSRIPTRRSLWGWSNSSC